MTSAGPGPSSAPDLDQPAGSEADPHGHLCTVESAPLVRGMLERVADRWTMWVIGTLSDGPMRFTAIQDSVPGISHRMLTVTLRALERDGMVTRTAYAQVPPRVEYELTALGRGLILPVQGLMAWVREHRHEVEANRRDFDAR